MDPHFLSVAALSQYVLRWDEMVYVIIFVGLLFEGEAVLLAAYFLVNLGYLNIFGVTAIAVISVVSGDILWYFLGANLGQSSALGKWLTKVAYPLDCQLTKKPFRTIFVSKFAYGTHRITLLRSGWLKIDFWRYLKYTFFSSMIWIILIGALGLASAYAAASVFPHYLKIAELGLLASLIIAYLLSWIIFKLTKRG